MKRGSAVSVREAPWRATNQLFYFLADFIRSWPTLFLPSQLYLFTPQQLLCGDNKLGYLSTSIHT
jgi:hypothetical protein